MNHNQTAAAKARAQVQLVLEMFGAAGITIGVQMSDTGIDYLYEEGTLLVRDGYVPRVLNVVGGGEVVDGLIGGVSRCTLDGAQISKVGQALERIDDQLGIGVATPNHVLSVSPTFLCPATEPEVVPADAPPVPAVSDLTAGEGVCICVIDTGLLANAGTHPWLAGVSGEEEKLPASADGRVQIPPYAGHGTFIAGVARCVAPAADVHVMNLFSLAGVSLETDIVMCLDQALGLARHHQPVRGRDQPRRPAAAGIRDVLGTLPAAQGHRPGRGGGKQRRQAAVLARAAFPGVVSVGALSCDHRSRARFSDYGPWVDVYAPGERLVNAYAYGDYRYHEPPRRHARRVPRDGPVERDVVRDARGGRPDRRADVPHRRERPTGGGRLATVSTCPGAPRHRPSTRNRPGTRHRPCRRTGAVVGTSLSVGTSLP